MRSGRPTKTTERRSQLRSRESTRVASGLSVPEDDEIFAKVRQLGLEADVVFPGFVSDAEQALWYRASSVFAYPSLYEGFGIPVAEALICGILR